MPQRSAGLILFRRRPRGPEILLAHPGGPYWARKDEGAWSIPKGLCEEGEDAAAAAKREFEEEIGFAPSGEYVALGLQFRGALVANLWRCFLVAFLWRHRKATRAPRNTP